MHSYLGVMYRLHHFVNKYNFLSFFFFFFFFFVFFIGVDIWKSYLIWVEGPFFTAVIKETLNLLGNTTYGGISPLQNCKGPGWKHEAKWFTLSLWKNWFSWLSSNERIAYINGAMSYMCVHFLCLCMTGGCCANPSSGVLSLWWTKLYMLNVCIFSIYDIVASVTQGR